MNGRIHRGAALALLASALVGPAHAQDSETPAGDAAAAFARLETRLVDASAVRLAFDVVSEGAVESALRGTLAIDGDGRVQLLASGTFGGQPVELRVSSDGRTYTYGNANGSRTEDAPPHLEEALLVGLTRMGVLHNLAMLTAGSPPDRANGEIREWVRARDVGWNGDAPPAVEFAIEVSGTRVGNATLALDPRGGPLLRHQTVQFPEGEMRVVERYSDVEIEP